MMHPMALQAVFKARQRDVLEEAKWRRRAQAAFGDQERLRKAQASLTRCGQTERMSILPKGIQS